MVTFQRATPPADDFSDAPTAWASLATVRAEVRAVSDRERFQAAERQAEISHRLRCVAVPALADLSASDRAVIGGAVHEIIGVKPLPRGRFLEITTVARGD